MNADQIQIGNLPWQPENHEDSRTTINETHFPTAGRYFVDGESYGFLCIEGKDADNNMWVYGKVNDNSQNRITREEFETMGDFVRYITHTFDGSPVLARSINYQIAEVMPTTKSELARLLISTHD